LLMSSPRSTNRHQNPRLSTPHFHWAA
jgi:hypothetical protein